MNSVPKILSDYGFARAGSCSCGGTRNDIYKKDGYSLYYRKTRFLFKIKKKNETVVPVQGVTNLENVLKQLFPDVAVAEEKV
jgi:hypothetical protein